MTESHIFEEKQYLGYNKFSFIVRMLLVMFCFLANVKTENSENSGDMFTIVGVTILVVSLLLIFVLHFKTTVYPNSVVLDGLWTARKVKIDLSSVNAVREIKYSNIYLNRSVYNLHRKGKIRFYTRGHRAVELVDKDGLIYVIGTQRPAELARVLNEHLSK